MNWMGAYFFHPETIYKISLFDHTFLSIHFFYTGMWSACTKLKRLSGICILTPCYFQSFFFNFKVALFSKVFDVDAISWKLRKKLKSGTPF